jgi:AraC-like DNA-binding protein
MATSAPPRYTWDQYGARATVLRAHHQKLRTSVPVHWHEFYELGYVLAGEGIHVVNGGASSLSPGDLFILTPADFHEITLAPHATLELVDAPFHAELLEKDAYRLVAGVQVHVPPNSEVATDFQRLIAEQETQGLGSEFVMRATLLQIVVAAARLSIVRSRGRVAAPAPAPGESHELHLALMYVQQHFRQHLTLAEVAAQAHMSPNYFSERFTRIAGMPYSRYLYGLRLEFARSLLGASELPVTEICFAAGYRTLSHFERAYKQRYGRSPSQDRGVDIRSVPVRREG